MEKDILDIKAEAFNAGFNSGIKHSQPSPETQKFIQQTIKENATIGQKLDDLCIANNEAHKAILLQTTATNGKVAEISKWRERLTGGFIVFNVILWPIILLLVGQAVSAYFNK